MKIVTGHTGQAHVTSNNDGEFNQGIWGDGLIVLNNGNKLNATIGSGTVTIADGDLVFQGRHALIDYGDTEVLSIATGTVNMNRKDLICVQYKSEAGVESMSLVVKKGTASSGTAPDPAYTTGVIRTGAVLAEAPLYRVNLSGSNITSVERLAPVIPYIVDVARKKIEYGTSLPSASDYNDGDMFLLYS